MESVFQSVGTCGCFQVCHVFCIQLIRMANAWCLYLMAFGNYEPPWECVQRNGSSRRHSDTKWTTNTSSYDVIEENVHPLDNDPFSIMHSNSTNESNTSLRFRQGTCGQLPLCDEIRFDPASVTLVTEFELICDQAYIPSLIIAVQMSGMVVGAYLGGQLGESYGRKVSIYSSLALMSAATFIATWSISWQMHVVLTFLIGLGAGGIAAICQLYAMEFLTPTWRGRLASLPTWYLSLIMFALIVMALKNWRHIYLLTSIASSLILLGAVWVPESLRWLHVNGKDSDVKKVLEKALSCNGRRGHDRNVDEIFTKLKEDVQEDGGAPKKYTLSDVFKNRKLRIVLIRSTTIGFFLAMAYYTLGFSVKALSGDYYTNLLLSCSLELPFLILVIPFVNRIGRKFTVTGLSGLGALCTLACVIAYYVTTYEVSGPIIAYLGIFAKGFSGVGWVTYTVYSAELFPTAVRSVAMGFLNTVARVGTVLGAILIPRDIESLVVCFIVLCVGMIVSCLVILTLPETKGIPLEDEVERQRNSNS